jgi:hypothetical protein
MLKQQIARVGLATSRTGHRQTPQAKEQRSVEKKHKYHARSGTLYTNQPVRMRTSEYGNNKGGQSEHTRSDIQKPQHITQVRHMHN